MSYILRPYPDVIKAAIGRIVKDERIKANAKRVNERRIEMQELEKILEEIEQKQVILKPFDAEDRPTGIINVDIVKEIIRKHINDGWIPVDRELPPNAKHKGALCPRYQVMTKYGVTEGWYNPDLESWYILIWFMTERYLDSEIDFERGTWPKIVRCENKVNDRHGIVMAWRPLPEPYHPERSGNK